MQSPETPHPQEATQQGASPKVKIIIVLEAEDIETESRACELPDNFDPETTACVEVSCGHELFMYLQSDVSKVSLILQADPSEPRMRIGGAFELSVDLKLFFGVSPGIGKFSTRLKASKDRPTSGFSRSLDAPWTTSMNVGGKFWWMLTAKNKMFLAEENSGRVVVEVLAKHQWSEFVISRGPALFMVVRQMRIVTGKAAMLC